VSAPRARIVLADDEDAARRSLGEILTEDGYAVRLAADGEEALRLVAEDGPDILLTDRCRAWTGWTFWRGCAPPILTWRSW
jgi:CheY-like chemotaxis protein